MVWWVSICSPDVADMGASDLIADQIAKDVGMGEKGSSFLTVSKKSYSHLLLCL